MPLSPALKAAAEQVAKNAPITENHRNALKTYLTEAYAELRYTSDELFIRALLKCCACLSIYKQRDRAYLGVWLSRILKEINEQCNKQIP
jgi:hypothetical protein